MLTPALILIRHYRGPDWLIALVPATVAVDAAAAIVLVSAVSP